MMRLVYLSPVPAASFAQRPQKFVEWFHERTGGQVIWVDPYPTRFPRLSDLHRPREGGATEGHTQPNWLMVLKPKGLPLEPLPGAGWINALFWLSTLNELASFASGHETLVVIGKPSVLALAVLKRLKGAHSVYDSMDEFPAFYKGLSSLSMAHREEQLVRQVDVLWVTSTKLKERWSTLRPDLQLVPNGLDTSLLPSPRIGAPKPASKIFGYVGTIAAWFDWEWVIALARKRPDDIVRLIGPVYQRSAQKLPSNIEMLPACQHQDALAAMLDFDVGLVPFLRSSLTDSVDPIKYYEYRALGLPVMSTDFGEMKGRKNFSGTYVSRSVEDIEGLAISALNFIDDIDSIEYFTKENSWRTRFDSAFQICFS